MRDKRSVDELSIQEIEQLIVVKRREARQAQMQRMQRSGRVVSVKPQGVDHEEVLTDLASQSVTSLATAQKPVPTKNISNVFAKHKADTSRVKPKQQVLDHILLLIEGGALTILITLGMVFLQSISSLENETARFQLNADTQLRASMPTFAPTPVLQLADIVLPGGHKPPTTADGGQFNFEEIPVSLRGQVRDQMLLLPEMIRPPTTSETAQRIVLPDIGIDKVIVQGIDPEALKLGVGQLPNGVTPMSGGNLVLAAHNDVYGEIFRDIVNLKPGMFFDVYTEKQVYTYVVTGSDIVTPQDIQVMGNRGGATATLITCYPYRVNTQRYIVYAERVDT